MSRSKAFVFTIATRLLLLFLMLPDGVQAQYGYTNINNTITIIKSPFCGGAVTIPPGIDGFPVTSIGNYAFFNWDIRGI